MDISAARRILLARRLRKVYTEKSCRILASTGSSLEREARNGSARDSFVLKFPAKGGKILVKSVEIARARNLAAATPFPDNNRPDGGECARGQNWQNSVAANDVASLGCSCFRRETPPSRSSLGVYGVLAVHKINPLQQIIVRFALLPPLGLEVPVNQRLTFFGHLMESVSSDKNSRKPAGKDFTSSAV